MVNQKEKGNKLADLGKKITSFFKSIPQRLKDKFAGAKEILTCSAFSPLAPVKAMPGTE